MTGCTDLWAVIPVKDFTQAKQRLRARYSQQFRTALAQAMLEDVLAAVSRVKALSGIIIVTVDATAAAIARRYGVQLLHNGAEAGHTGAVAAAVQMLASDGRGGILVVPGDIPLVTSSEIESVIRLHAAAPAFTIVPAHDEKGSNAIICSPPDRVPLQFGNNSFLPHLEAARRCGLSPKVAHFPGISLDIDCPGDLDQFMREPSSTGTWALLESQGLVASLPAARPYN